uniref:Response regulatory domain-containing protein n=1 Tax=Aegilops tauschii subsp. strangulata TaxID=200361 RepID=A0A453KAA6_AEGTS
MVITLVFSTHLFPTPYLPGILFHVLRVHINSTPPTRSWKAPSLSCQAHTPPAFPLPHSNSIHLLLHQAKHTLALSSPMAVAIAEAPFHVLAVDDSVLDRKLIERLLKTSSFQ